MADPQVLTAGDLRVALVDAAGPKLDDEQSALDLMGEAYGVEADLVGIPKARLAPDFCELANRKLGLAIQKFTNYGVRVAFIGDFSAETAKSNAFRDFVRETNKGRSILFVRDMEELAAKAIR